MHSVALIVSLVTTTPERALERALDLRAQGRTADAVTLLADTAQGPDAPANADDCLAEAARWSSDELHTPQRSRALWLLLLARHPLSRHAPKARAQADWLGDLLAEGGAAPAAEFLRIQRSASWTPDQRVAALHSLKTRRPDWPGLHRVDAMLAGMVAAGPRPAPRPDLGLAAALALALAALFGWGRRGARPGQGLWPPPMEVRFLAPIYALLGGAALAQPRGSVLPLWRVIAVVGGGTMAWTWLSAAALRGRPARSTTARWILPLAGATFVAGLCLFALRWQGLAAEALETLTVGPER